MLSCTRSIVVTACVAGLLSCLSVSAADAVSPAATDAAATAVSDLALLDTSGKRRSLRELQQDKLLVVFFTGTQCPLAKLYGPRMQRLADAYQSQGVSFVAIGPNVQDSAKELAAYATEHGIRFPVLCDPQQAAADLLKATRTPEVFVLDTQHRVRYQGRVDGQFTFGAGVGLSQPAPKRHDLKLALNELLAGKPVSLSRTQAKGCLIGRAKKPQPTATVTYSNQIARLFQAKCVECHRDGQIAPFALTDYDEAAGWADMIAEVVRDQRMPPWHANPKYGHFQNENRLTDAEKQLVYDWVAQGCPEGDSADLPKPKTYREGWFMTEQPDMVVHMSDKPVEIKAQGVEDYRYYVVDPGFKTDRWVRIAECLPGNRSVVHHIIVYIQSPESKDSNIGEHELLVGFAPGTRPFDLPEGWARRIPAGSKLIFEMHYTPIGTPQQDRSKLGLVFMDESEVTHHCWTTNAIQTKLRIPAGAENHPEYAEKVFRQDVQLMAMFPHMHMRGKSFRYELTYPDGRQEILLDIPQYDFNWQTSFVLPKPMLIPKGSRLFCTAHFDNSDKNLANPDPTQTVYWGEQTWEEMLIGWHDIAVPWKRQ